MEEGRIYYKDILGSGFTEQVESDKVYEGQFGFPYSIIEYKLTPTLYLDWEKSTGKCVMNRLDKNGYIVATMPIKNIETVKELINFFKQEIMIDYEIMSRIAIALILLTLAIFVKESEEDD